MPMRVAIDWTPERITAEIERTLCLDRIRVVSKEAERGNSPLHIMAMKQKYNNIMQHIEQICPHPPNDPVEILPLELFTSCIELALPLTGVAYTPALLQLTMVSRRWNTALLSISSLWASITFNGWDEDSLAMIAVSLYLSHNAMISLTVCLPLLEGWKQACGAIIPHSHRIRGITLIGTPLAKEFHNQSPTWEGRIYCLALASIIDSIGSPPSIVSIDLGTSYALPMDWLVIPLGIHPAIKPDNFNLPSNLHYMRQCSFRFSLLGNLTESLVQLRELHTQEPISVLLPILQNFASLENLKVTDTDWWHLYGDNFTLPSPLSPEQEGCRPPNITSFTYAQPFSDTLLIFLPQIASNMREAILRIPYSMAGFLISVLNTMTRLHSLSITLSQLQGNLRNPPSARPITRSASAVHTLQSLSLRGYEKMARPGKEVPTPNSMELTRELISTHIALYPDVIHGHIELGHDLDWALVIPLLQNMRGLRSLSIYGNGEPSQGQIDLPKLEELVVEGESILSCLITPNILRLINEGEPRSQLQAFCQRSPEIRSITFTDGFIDEAHVFLDATAFSHVCELQLVLTAYGLNETTIWPTLYLPALHSLRKIVLSFSDNVFCQATSLCLALLFEPELCPTLQELHFEGYPEWDYLFLMLEARNFSRDSSISRISTLTVSHIPSHLRSPLASLLRGEFTSRPSNEELSLEATREMILDENIPGCFTCVHSMMGTCRTAVSQYNSMNYWYVASYGEEGYWAPLPEQPLPPGTSQEVAKWVSGRPERLRRWKILTAKWVKRYHRILRCDERRYSEPVTITGFVG